MFQFYSNRMLVGMLSAIVLCACGGGGGDDSSTPGVVATSPPAQPPAQPPEPAALQFPASLTYVGRAGDEVILTVRAGQLLTEPVHVSVVDNPNKPAAEPVLVEGPVAGFQQLASVHTDPPTYEVRLRIPPSAWSARHRGVLTFAVCLDAPACAKPYAVPRVSIPYDIDILPPPAVWSGPDVVDIGGEDGRTPGSTSFMMLLSTHNPVALPWTVEGVPDWLTLSATQGTATGWLPLEATVTPGFVGHASAQLTFSAQDGDTRATKTVRVDVGQDALKLVLQKPTMQVVMSGSSIVQTTSQVLPNLNRTVSWRADSDQAWLQVTPLPGSTTAMSLTIQGALIPTEGWHVAHITLTPDRPGVVVPEKMVVGVLKTTAGPAQVSTLPTTGAVGDAVTDPVRPRLYVIEGGEVAVYDFHTASRIGSLAHPGLSASALAVAQDGSRLFVGDSQSRVVHVFDLASWTTVARYPAPQQAVMQPMLYLRPNGTGIVLLGGKTPMLASTGEILDSRLATLGPVTHVAVSQEHNVLAVVEAGGGARYWRMYYGEAQRGKLLLTGSTRPPVLPASSIEYRSLVLGDGYFAQEFHAVTRTPGDRWRCTRWEVGTGNYLGDLTGPDDALQFLGVNGHECLGTRANVASGQPSLWRYQPTGSLPVAGSDPVAVATAPGDPIILLLRPDIALSSYNIALGSRTITFTRPVIY